MGLGWFLGLFACESKQRRVVTIFHAASLARSLMEVEEVLERLHPELDLQLEPSGSQTAARKISELNRRADLVVAADWRVLERLLLPKHAQWILRFAGNEIVLAHLEHSLHTADINAENWPRLLLDPKIRLGRADENTAPIGFQTLVCWNLAERSLDKPGLVAKLKARCRDEHVVPDVGELVSLLSARSIDYAFVFRSIAEEHNLKVVGLPDRLNLKNPALASWYGQVSVQNKRASIKGAPIVYGLSVPTTAKNPQDAYRVIRFLLGDQGRRILARSGFGLLSSFECDNSSKLPKELKGFLDPGGRL